MPKRIRHTARSGAMQVALRWRRHPVETTGCCLWRVPDFRLSVMGLLVGRTGRRFVCFAIKCSEAGCPDRLAASEADCQSTIFDSTLAAAAAAGPWSC